MRESFFSDDLTFHREVKRGEGGAEVKKVKGEEAGVLQQHTPLPHTHTCEQQPA